jgi:hypothetical protein
MNQQCNRRDIDQYLGAGLQGKTRVAQAGGKSRYQAEAQVE